MRYYLPMLIAILGWGLSPIFIEFGLVYLGPLTFLFLRFFLAFVVMSIFILPKRLEMVNKMIKNKWVWIIGISESLGLIFQYLGQEQSVPAGLSALLSLNFLIIVPFLSPIFLGERVHLNHLFAVFLGLVGVLLIATEGDISSFVSNSIKGIVFLSIAAFCYALYIVITSRYTTIENTDTDVLSLFYIVSLIITLISFSMAIMFEDFNIPSSFNFWQWIIYLVIFSTIIAFIAYFDALKGISANEASVLLLFQVVIPFAVEFLFGRRYSLWVWMGVFLVTLSMIVVVSKNIIKSV